MPEGENKPQEAKCRYYKACAIYGSSILKPEYERQMCQPGQKIDQTYVPRIPEDIEEKPKGLTYIGADATCPAFERFVYAELYFNLEDLVGDVERILHGKLPLYEVTEVKKPSK